jgi:hypothetical protein
LGGGDRVERLYYVIYRDNRKSSVKFMMVDGNGKVFTRKALKLLGYTILFCDTKNVVKTFINRGKEEFFKSYSTSKEGWDILCGIDLNEKYHVNKLDEMFDDDKREMFEKLIEKFYGIKTTKTVSK